MPRGTLRPLSPYRRIVFVSGSECVLYTVVVQYVRNVEDGVEARGPGRRPPVTQTHPPSLNSSSHLMNCTSYDPSSHPGPPGKLSQSPFPFQALSIPAPNSPAQLFPMLPAASSAVLSCSSRRLLMSIPPAVSLLAPIASAA